MNLGDAVPQTPWDLARSCHPMYVLFLILNRGGADLVPGMVWPRKSALRSHPCVALSSAPVPISVNHNRLRSTGQVTNHRKKIAKHRLTGYN
jgi:hypothetical protein